MGSHIEPTAPVAHESSHVDGGSDEIDSALALTAIPSITFTKLSDTTQALILGGL